MYCVNCKMEQCKSWNMYNTLIFHDYYSKEMLHRVPHYTNVNK